MNSISIDISLVQDFAAAIGGVIPSDSFLLQQDGAYFLLQNGTDSIILN
jgi:hypothetical protein